MAPDATKRGNAERGPQGRAALAVSFVAAGARRGLGLLSLALLLAAVLATGAQAASVGLGTADRFGVLGASTVTNTGPSTLAGDLGVSPGTAVTGFPPGTVGGAIHANDAVAQQAQTDLTTAYNDAAGRSSTGAVSGDLAGRTLSPGVYTSASSLGLSGDLTLDAHGDANAVFVFQAGSTLTTAAGSRVLLIGGAQACNVFWQVGSSATIGTSTAFTGNILALTSISLTTGATLNGRALARNGAVTLDTNTVTLATCAGSAGTTSATTTTTQASSGSASGATTTTTTSAAPVRSAPTAKPTVGKRGRSPRRPRHSPARPPRGHRTPSRPRHPWSPARPPRGHRTPSRPRHPWSPARLPRTPAGFTG